MMSCNGMRSAWSGRVQPTLVVACHAYVTGAGVILFITAMMKVLGVWMEPALGRSDALFPWLRTSSMLLAAALLELGAVWRLCTVKSITDKLAVVLWVSCIFLLYRLGIVWIGARTSCHCLGSVGVWFGLGADGEDRAAKIILSYLVVGSSFFLAVVAKGSMIPKSSQGGQP